MLRISISSELRMLSTLRSWLERAVRSRALLSATAEEIFQLQLAVQETATNIILHSQCEATDQVIDVTALFKKESVEIEFWYEGLAFEGASVALPVFDGSREHGFGLFIVGQLMDDVEYGQSAAGKNFIRLKKCISGKEVQTHDRN